jgi:phosphate transport system substrate-binding protein
LLLRLLRYLICFFCVASVALAANEKIVITGSSTVAPLILEIAKRFENQNAGTQIDVQSGGSGRGISDVRSGVAAIGMVSRALKPDDQLLNGFVIARDGICIILNSSNPIKTLNDEQIKGIYTGRITNWKELGGVDRAITVVNKAGGRSTLELFASYFNLKNSDIKAQVVIGDNQQGIKTVAGNPGAVGYVSIGSAEFEAGNKTRIKLLPLNDVVASVANVRNGTFPLSRPLTIVTKVAPEGVVKRFIAFAQSTAVNDLITEQFFVPLAIR